MRMPQAYSARCRSSVVCQKRTTCRPIGENGRLCRSTEPHGVLVVRFAYKKCLFNEENRDFREDLDETRKAHLGGGEGVSPLAWKGEVLNPPFELREGLLLQTGWRHFGARSPISGRVCPGLWALGNSYRP
jgi:hypothetical protein